MNDYLIIITAVSISTIVSYLLRPEKQKEVKVNDIDLSPLLMRLQTLEHEFEAFQNKLHKINDHWHTKYIEQKEMVLKAINILQDQVKDNNRSITKINKIVYKKPTSEEKNNKLAEIVDDIENINTITI